MRAAQLTTLVLACVLIAGCSKETSSTTTTTDTASSAPTSLADAAAATTPPAADASAGATTAAAAGATTAAMANATSSASSAANATTATSAAATVAFTDISGNYAEKAIVGLGQLGVLDATSGTFQPSKPVLRREFIRWLFKTNNAVFADTPAKQIHPAEGGDKSGFSDLKSGDPDFKYIEGMDEAGISVGFPDKTFKADQPLTHEQAIAIKAVLDRGGVTERYVRDPDTALGSIPDWKDKKQIGKAFAPAIATDHLGDSTNSLTIDNVGRTFGAVAMFRPQAPVTRAQAAMLLQVIGAHTSDTNRPNEPRSVAAALNPSPKPTP